MSGGGRREQGCVLPRALSHTSQRPQTAQAPQVLINMPALEEGPSQSLSARPVQCH